MHYNYNTTDTCATKIEFDLENGRLHNLEFTGGCNGNLQAIPILVEGLNAEEVKEKLGNVRCGRRPTSCTAQLALAIEKALDEAI